jgi:regulator of sigma E protease
MVILQNALWLLILLGVMILVHELGHYVAARFFDVRVETFSFGFGPRLFGFRKGETDFRFSAIMFGGYVKMAGEQPGEDSINDPRSLLAKPRWQRVVIAFAGPFMNLVLALAVLTGLFMYKYPKPMAADLSGVVGHVLKDSPAAKAGVRDGDRIVRIGDIENPTWTDITMKVLASANHPLPVTLERKGRLIHTTVTPTLLENAGVGFAGWSEEAEIQIIEVSPGMPAEKAGFRKGDLLLRINGIPIHSSYKVHELIRASNGSPVTIEYMRDGEKKETTVTPVFADLDGQPRWMVGFIADRRVVYTSLDFPHALSASVDQNMRMTTLLYQFLRGIVERRMSAKSIDGPIRIAQLSGEAAREGLDAFLGLMAAVSLNLAVINLLPIPILDGGVILLLLVEMIMRRDLSATVKDAVFKFGFVFLVAVMAFVLFNDLSKILPSG